MMLAMPRILRNGPGTAWVSESRKTHADLDKQGQRRQYTSAYLRRTYRDGATVRNETVANLSMLPAESVDAIEKGARR